MSYEQILYEVDDPVATITLNRPEFLNAFTTQMGHELRHAVGAAERDRNVVGIVITGAGRGFCAGADMKMLSGITEGSEAPPGNDAPAPAASVADADAGDPSWGDDLRGTYTYLMSVPKPIIAAINGPIAGMAVPIALACDLRFMANDAVLTVAFSQRGLIAEWGVGWLLPRLIGSGAALDLLFSSRKVDGVECERLGLVNRAVDGDVAAVAQDYVRDLAAKCSPASLAVMKRQVYQQLHAGLGDKEREAQRLMLESFDRPDFAEGVQSFLQKRPPKFSGSRPNSSRSMAGDLVVGDDGKARCPWGTSTPEYVSYHDTEWGFGVTDDHRLFEKLCLEGFQSGLSWLTILRKRDAFRAAFAGFDFAVVATFDDGDVERLLGDAGIVRHQGKIRSTINNAQRALELVHERGSLAAHFWPHASFGPAPVEIASTTPVSVALANDLKKRGWTFVGPTTVYAFMQAMGLVNDHHAGCWVRDKAEKERRRAARLAK